MQALPKASLLALTLAAAPLFAAEVERIPELAPTSPVAPAIPSLQTPQLPLSDFAAIPTLTPMSALLPAAAVNPAAASNVRSASAQAATAQVKAASAKPGALAAVQTLSAQMGSERATASSRRENLSSTFDAAKPAGGAGTVAADGEGGEGSGAPPAGGGGNNGRGKDDGGGATYPVRMIRALGTTFKAVLFRPNVPIESEIVRAIDQTQKGDKIRISIYEFGNGRTLDALRKARQRKVDVKIILDYSNVFPEAKGGGYTPKISKEIWGLMREGFDVSVLKGLGQYGINHNKICVIQSTRGSLGIFGSYNWKWTAERDHYENANFTSDRKRIEALYSYWNWLNGLSVKASYNHTDGSIDLADPDHEWPKTVPPPPQFNETVEFNGVELPFLVVSPASQGAASAEDEIVRAYDAAKKSIQVSIFALRSTKIAEALKRAKERQLETVQVIIDKGQSTSEAFKAYADWLAYHGIEVKVLSGPDPTAEFQLSQKDHHKFSILDGKLVEVGSTNYTKYASIGNFENAHFLDDETDAKSYSFMFDHMWERAETLARPATEPVLPSDDELIREVFPTENPSGPTPSPAPIPDGPLPSWPRPAARTIAFNGETYKAVMTKPDDAIVPELAKLIKSAKKSVRLSAYEFNLPELLDALRWLRANRPKVKIEVVIDRSHVYTTGRDHTGGPRKPSPQIVALIREGFDVVALKGDHSGIMHSKYLLIDAPSSGLRQSITRAAQKLSAQAVSGLASAFGGQWLTGLADTMSAGEARRAATETEQTGLVARGSYNFAVTAENNHYENIALTTEKERVQNYLNDFNYKRKLAEEIDHDKLDEILARDEVPTRKGSRRQSDDDENDPESAWLSSEGASDVEAAEPDAARKPRLPSPPESADEPIDINGEKFKTEYFSPNGGVMDAWLRGIKAAKTSVDIAMFGFYSRDLADALVAAVAEKRKTNKDFRLRIALDAGQAALAKFDRTPGDRTSGTRVADWLKERGIDVKLNGGPHWRSKADPRDPMFEKMHSKYMIIDGKWVFTGSWNASDRAEEDNFENMTVLVDPSDVAMLVWDFERIYLRSLGPGEREPVQDDTGNTSLPGL